MQETDQRRPGENSGRFTFLKHDFFTKRLVAPLFLYTVLLLTGCSESLPDKRNLILDTQGAIIRGDTAQPELALIFSADSLAEGRDFVATVLEEEDVPASFFFTGNFYRNTSYRSFIKKLLKDDHYLGAHSDRHLLYCDWTFRDSTLVSEKEFLRDIGDNYDEMKRFGILKKKAGYFLPPYEWYNREIVTWSLNFGASVINFTPGTRTNADYTYPEMGNRYLSRDSIWNNLIKVEQNRRNGLNGHILLVHLGTDPRRRDKFYHYLPRLIRELREKGYRFVRIDDLLK